MVSEDEIAILVQISSHRLISRFSIRLPRFLAGQASAFSTFTRDERAVSYGTVAPWAHSFPPRFHCFLPVLRTPIAAYLVSFFDDLVQLPVPPHVQLALLSASHQRLLREVQGAGQREQSRRVPEYGTLRPETNQSSLKKTALRVFNIAKSQEVERIEPS